MGAKVYAANLVAETLDSLVADLKAVAPYAILERLDRVKCPGLDEAWVAHEWASGRIFGEGLELCWESRGGVFHVVVCRDDGCVPAGLTECLDLDGYQSHVNYYYLWGEDEVRIGRRLEYCAIPGKGRPQLSVVEYRHRETGRLEFYRYADLRREVTP
jgi:hypothetical protein